MASLRWAARCEAFRVSARLCGCLGLVASVAGALIAASVPALACEAYKRPYRVEDSIELTTIRDPAPLAAAKLSDDHAYALAVVKKGDLVRGTNKFSLLVVSLARRRHADKERDARVVSEVAVLETRGNAPAIDEARWGSAEHVFFIGRERDLQNRIYRVNIHSKRIESWVEHPTEILAYAIAGNTVFYAARPPRDTDSRAQAAIQVRNQTPTQLLTSQESSATGIEYFVWSQSHGERKVHAQAGSVYPSAIRVWISPSGKQGVLLQRPEQIPTAWHGLQWKSGASELAATEDSTRVPIQTLQFMRIDLESGRVEPLIDAPTGWSIASYHDFDVAWIDDESVIVLNTLVPHKESTASAAGPPRAHIVEVNLRSQALIPVTTLAETRLGRQGAGAMTGMIWHESDLRLEVERVGRRGPVPSLWFERSAGGKWLPLKPAETFPRVAVMQSLNSPAELAVQTSPRSPLQPITNLNPQLQCVLLEEVEVFRWRDSKGNEWRGGLITPHPHDPGVRAPLVIQTHGFDERGFLADGGGALMDGAETSVFAARALAGRRMAVLQVDDNLDVEGGSMEGVTYLDGYLSAVRALDEAGRIDPAKVGLAGFSRTSYHVKYALAFSHQFAAAVVADGVDMGYLQYLLTANNKAGADIQPLYERVNGARPFGSGIDAWQRSAPGFNTDKITVPVRIEGYGQDSILWEWEFYAGLKSLGRPVEFFYYPDAAHSLAKPSERFVSQTGTVDWFDFWLNRTEDSDSTEAEQFARWRKLSERALQDR